MTTEDKITSEQLRGRVEYWKQVVSIQMHFNDMCIRTRWLGLTAIATLMAAAAVAAKDNVKVRIFTDPELSVGLPSILMIVASMLLLALYLLDAHYYYKMLLASVEFGEKLESRIARDILHDGEGVTSAISRKVSRRRAAVASKGFYLLIGAVILLFLWGSFLPRS